jgi:hypothetical protein
LDFRFWILDWPLAICDWRFVISDFLLARALWTCDLGISVGKGVRDFRFAILDFGLAGTF